MPSIVSRFGLYFYLLTAWICLTCLSKQGLAQPTSPPWIEKSLLLYWADDTFPHQQLPVFWSERKQEAKELWLHATRRGVLPHVSTLSVIEKLPLMLEAMGLNDSHHRVPIRERR